MSSTNLTPDELRFVTAELEKRDRSNLGALIRVARSRAGISLRQACALTGIRAVELSQIELGKRLPTEDEALRMVEAYHLPVKTFVFHREEGSAGE